MSRSLIISGASRGIGRGIAEHFLERGYEIIGISRGSSSLKHDNYQHYCVDIRNYSDIRAFFSEVRGQSKEIFGLINNAGVITSMNSLVVPAASVEEMIDVNFKGAFFMTREAAKTMAKNKKGRIVNISSMAAGLKPNGDAVYAATKAILPVLGTVLTKEYYQLGITCNTLGITHMETQLSRMINQKALGKVIENLPMPRSATMADITNVLEFFLDEKSSYVSGQTIQLGGVEP